MASAWNPITISTQASQSSTILRTVILFIGLFSVPVTTISFRKKRWKASKTITGTIIRTRAPDCVDGWGLAPGIGRTILQTGRQQPKIVVGSQIQAGNAKLIPDVKELQHGHGHNHRDALRQDDLGQDAERPGAIQHGRLVQVAAEVAGQIYSVCGPFNKAHYPNALMEQKAGSKDQMLLYTATADADKKKLMGSVNWTAQTPEAVPRSPRLRRRKM